ncbi:hypothetical protein Vretimale_14267 [Volvox reticuliferus]|nr:hypothetical protein Vretifemale_15261 [Volvox reticuliferus]GIM10674.1 hypothetical protein Vretimale_14265 [Volvox reticuliferus]GIM10681.1 hypothetical protein Vretimale_14267 [Volvox reticuliferus]
MPVGGPGGGPLEVRLTRTQLDELTQELWRRCRLPLDQACWQAGVDLNEVVGDHETLKEQLRNRGVPGWKIQAAGILQGEISNLMVMDQWQASLMRALAKLQLQSDPRVKQRLEQQYSLEDKGESVVNGDEYGDGGGDEDRVEGGSRTGGRKPAAAAAGPKRLLSKRQRRRQQQRVVRRAAAYRI